MLMANFLKSCAPVPEELYEVTDQGLILGDQKPPTILDLFKPRIILFRSLNMFLQWFSVTMGYYGLLFASTGLSGNNLFFGFVLIWSGIRLTRRALFGPVFLGTT